MNKSILVIDTPSYCGVCDLCDIDNATYRDYCRATNNYIYTSDIPDWCPLKPMPEKFTIYPGDMGASAYEARGYNRCINEILGR